MAGKKFQDCGTHGIAFCHPDELWASSETFESWNMDKHVADPEGFVAIFLRTNADNDELPIVVAYLMAIVLLHNLAQAE